MYVAVRELKSSLSRVLSLAQDGEVIEVTSHNKPIARILGIPKQADEGILTLKTTSPSDRSVEVASFEIGVHTRWNSWPLLPTRKFGSS